MIKKITVLAALFLTLCWTLQAQNVNKRMYVLYDAQGKEITYPQLVKELAKAEVVFLGEIHNCSVTHWLHLQLVQSLYGIHEKDLTIGAEMFEADNQLLVDEYLKSQINFECLEAETRLWPNYSTDYEPILYFAKEHHIPFVATNVPRRYANVVKEKGLEYLDSLSDEAKRYLPELPISFTFDSEKEGMFSMMRMMGGKETDTKQLAQAQAIKDATMAWFIAKTFRGHFIHLNGCLHSDMGGGILPYLEQYRPGTVTKTLCTVHQEDIDQLDEINLGRADFYICVPEDITRTY